MLGGIAVVVPCYRVRNHVLDVIGRIGHECSRIYVVDDCCPEGTGEFVLERCCDPRVTVITNPTNLGLVCTIRPLSLLHELDLQATI